MGQRAEVAMRRAKPVDEQEAKAENGTKAELPNAPKKEPEDKPQEAPAVEIAPRSDKPEDERGAEPKTELDNELKEDAPRGELQQDDMPEEVVEETMIV
eukprot:NODE_6536_length_498_cov_212.930023.p3 GENE.NODE_6536_length_498_cov_212.930023~~NODE_6536_length_498_cov_212.930023.p3  ORF type:complete len:99 (+),score=30.32 NODE_6536_length_498_cov_212.930023:3-299(+)